MTSTVDNWFYGPLGSTWRPALHMYLIMHCDGFRLKVLTSKHFQPFLCLSPSLSLLVQLPQPIRDSCPWFRLLHSARIDASQSHFPLVFTVQSVHLLSSAGKLIYLQTLGLLLQLKPGRSNPLKMHLVEPAPREVPIGVSSIAYRSWTSSARQRNQQRKDPLIWLSLHELLYKLQTRKPCSCNPSKRKVNKQQSVQLHSHTHFCILGSFVITQIRIFILSQM